MSKLSFQIKPKLRDKLIVLIEDTGVSEHLCLMPEFNLKLLVKEVAKEGEKTDMIFYYHFNNKIYQFEELVS